MYGQYVLENRPVSEIYIVIIMTAGVQRPSKQPSKRQSRGIRALAQALTDLQYKRLGYIGPLALSKVGENSLEVRLKGLSTAKYRDYVFSKIYQQVLYRLNPNKFIKLFQRVYIDWFDLKEGWNDYQSDGRIVQRVVFIVCKVTGYIFGYFTICPKKDENLPIVKDVVNWLQLRYDIKVHGEMDCIKTKRWLNGKGIDFERCVSDIYEQNGIVKTVEKTIIAKVRAMRLLKRFPHMF